MTRAVGLAAIAAAAAACQLPVEGASAPLVGGVVDDGHPSVVAVVGRRAACDAPEEIVCSGTLVGSRAVLTAAHCLDPVEPDELEVIAGADVGAPDVVLAVWRAYVHPGYDPGADPEGAADLALLVLEADAGPAPSALPGDLGAELVAGATARYVGFGSTGPFDAPGVRLTATTTVVEVTGAAVWTDDTGVPCGGDSGGALFVDTAGGEVLAGVVKASGPDCTQQGLAMRVDTAVDGFLAPALADAAGIAESGRPALDPAAALCSEPCETHADCPLGMLCLPERGVSLCGYRDLRPAAFGERCDTGETCAPVGQGSERDCRARLDCDAVDGGCGCRTAGGGGASLALVLVGALAVARQRRPWRLSSDRK